MPACKAGEEICSCHKIPTLIPRPAESDLFGRKNQPKFLKPLLFIRLSSKIIIQPIPLEKLAHTIKDFEDLELIILVISLYIKLRLFGVSLKWEALTDYSGLLLV